MSLRDADRYQDLEPGVISLVRPREHPSVRYLLAAQSACQRPANTVDVPARVVRG